MPVSRLTEKKRMEFSTRPDDAIERYLTLRLIGKATTPAAKRETFLNLKRRKFVPSFLGQLKPKMTLLTKALTEAELPTPDLPEVAVIGRSNCGKSTLLNSLCGRGGAQVSSRPGSTQELFFFRVGSPGTICLVDLPGYGYAIAEEAKRMQWTEFGLHYLKTRKNLTLVLLLIDGRWGFLDSDMEMMAFLKRNSIPFKVVVTKCDMEDPKILAKRLTVMSEELQGGSPRSDAVIGKLLIPISAKKRQGVDTLRELLQGFSLEKATVKERLAQRKRSKKVEMGNSAEEIFKKWGLQGESMEAGTVDGTETFEDKTRKLDDDDLGDEEDGIDEDNSSDAPEEQTQTTEPPKKRRFQAGSTPLSAFMHRSGEMAATLSRQQRSKLSEIVPFETVSRPIRKRISSALHLPDKSGFIGVKDESDFQVKGIAKWRAFGRPASKAPRLAPRNDVVDLVDATEKRTKDRKILSLVEAQKVMRGHVKRGHATDQDVPQDVWETVREGKRDDEAGGVRALVDWRAPRVRSYDSSSLRVGSSMIGRSAEVTRRSDGTHNVWLHSRRKPENVADKPAPRMGRHMK